MGPLARCLLAATLALVLGCGSVKANPEGKRIALSVSSTKQPFVSALASSLEREGASLGMKVTVLTAGYDAAVQAQQITDAIADKYDMLAISAFDAHAIIPTLTRAKAAGVPVVMVNAPVEPGHEDLYLTFVGDNKVELGRMAARSVIEAAAHRKTARTAIISGTSTDLTSRLQIDGFKEVADQNKKLELVAIEDARWDMANAERLAGQLFARFASKGGLDAMFTPVDSMAFGIIQAANAADIPLGTDEGKLIIVSSACMKFGLAPLRNGQLFSSIDVVPTRIAKVTASVIADFFNGTTPKPITPISVQEINKANVEEFAAACTF
jgi:ABC-type sugar transport system substrate-binding protein